MVMDRAESEEACEVDAGLPKDHGWVCGPLSPPLAAAVLASSRVLCLVNVICEMAFDFGIGGIFGSAIPPRYDTVS